MYSVTEFCQFSASIYLDKSVSHDPSFHISYQCHLHDDLFLYFWFLDCLWRGGAPSSHAVFIQCISSCALKCCKWAGEVTSAGKNTATETWEMWHLTVAVVQGSLITDQQAEKLCLSSAEVCTRYLNYCAEETEWMGQYPNTISNDKTLIK